MNRCMELGQGRSFSACNSMIVIEGGRSQVQGRSGVYIWPLDRYLGGSVILQAGGKREMIGLIFIILHLMVEELCGAEEGAIEPHSQRKYSWFASYIAYNPSPKRIFFRGA